MIEADWLASTDPSAMLEWIIAQPADRAAKWTNAPAHYVATDRKLRLFAVACCEAAGMKLLDEGETIERMSVSAAMLSRYWAVADANAGRPGQAAKAALLRCLFGNPFRSVPGFQCAKYQAGVWHETADWLTPAAITIARTIYADRRWDELPILADALEEAGCQSDDLLAHLRSPGPHARGCWALDLVLGKE